jgi:DNA polymerase-3 subunit beta
MRFVIQRDKLISAIQDVMKAVSARTVVPILSGIKIDVRENGIILTGSDSDITIESYIPAEDDGVVNVEEIEPGAIVLQAKYFPDIIRKLPEKTVEIEVHANFNVSIRSGKAQFNLNGQDAEEYPMLPQLLTEKTLEMPIPLLKNMIKQTVFAVSSMETRPILTGVNMTTTDNELHFIATDSHRLAKREVEVKDNQVTLDNIVVPGKSLTELNKILDDQEETVEISVANNQILFQTKYLKFLSRLLDGKYPETSRLIPTDNKTIIKANTKELLHTIDRASLLAREERNNVVKLSTLDNQVIEISSNSPEVGKVVEEIPANSIEGEELKISFSSKYMIEALRAIESDEILIQFSGPMRPFVIRPVIDDSILQLILPVRTY